MTTQPSARILCDSVGEYDNVRLTTVELVMHRFVLAEFNTHRALSRNSASSRAIPVEKTLERFRHDYAWPLSLPVERPGMSGGAELEAEDRVVATAMMRRIHDVIGLELANYVGSHVPEHRLHKSVLNRLMEYGQWHTVIATGDQYGWKHFLELRDHETAQPEIRAVAQALRVALDESTPTLIGYDEWHLPLTAWSNQPGAEEQFKGDEDLSIEQLKRVSAARCARVSYLTHQGTRDVEADYTLHDRLLGAGGLPHVSPFEHVATPDSDSYQWANHYGWRQYRRDAELEWEAMHAEERLNGQDDD